MHYAIAILLILVGFVAMATAWFILLTTATHNVNVVALELGGVVVCLAGYFLWKRCRPADAVQANEGSTSNRLE
jgi:nitrate reductase gamma subunit